MKTKNLAWSEFTSDQLLHKFYKRFVAGILIIGVLQHGWYERILYRNDAAIPKVACIFLATRYFEWFLEQWNNIRQRIPQAPQKNYQAEDKPQIDGRNVEDIAAFILETGGLKIEEMKKYFKVDAQQIKKLGNNLERVGIIGKGKNNARVLMTTDQEYILEMLLSSTDSDTIGRKSDTGIDYKPQPIA